MLFLKNMLAAIEKISEIAMIFYIFLNQKCESYEMAQPSCDSEIYCQGELLHVVQMAGTFPDSKTFVDMKLRFPAQVILQNFKKVMEPFEEKKGVLPSREVIRTFISQNFEEGKELEVWTPRDWVENPSILDEIEDTNYRSWASDLNMLWMNLSRKVSEDVRRRPDLYSLIYVPNGFVIPGGRFTELYYWDTYWIVNGLLICDMFETAKGVIENLLELVRKLGLVPNGSRVYYSRRTQPPLLTLMVASYFSYTQDMKFIRDNIEVLDVEMSLWLDTRTVMVRRYGKEYRLFRYFAPTLGPRPESYREDFLTAMKLNNTDEKFMKYVSIKSAAESGWDFSSRWFINNGTNKGNLSNTETQSIIPVELNAIMHKNFVLLTVWYRELGNFKKSAKYTRLSDTLLKAIEDILWNKEERMWFDYDVLNEKSRNYFYLSNIVPLWTYSYTFDKNYLSNVILNYINKQRLTSYPGGTPSSLTFSGEQWDYPNVWPPLQAFLIQGLDRLGTPEATQTAFSLANTYLYSNYIGYRNQGVMFEKYNAIGVGESGGGGEYEGQAGFGWTNGLIFELFKKFGDKLRFSERAR